MTSVCDILLYLSNQIKSNQILFIRHLSYFKSNTKCLTEAKNNNDTTYQPSHPHKYPERHGDKQTHKYTPTHTSSDPLHLSDRDMAGHPDLRQGKSYLGGPTTLRAPPQRQSRPGQTRGPTPRCRVLQPAGPEQSTGQHPR